MMVMRVMVLLRWVVGSGSAPNDFGVAFLVTIGLFCLFHGFDCVDNKNENDK